MPTVYNRLHDLKMFYWQVWPCCDLSNRLLIGCLLSYSTQHSSFLTSINFASSRHDDTKRATLLRNQNKDLSRCHRYLLFICKVTLEMFKITIYGPELYNITNLWEIALHWYGQCILCIKGRINNMWLIQPWTCLHLLSGKQLRSDRLDCWDIT